MRVEWYGQSAFRLSGAEKTVVIDPFGDLSAATGGRIKFDYPPIEPLAAELLLVTHEHADHNAVEIVTGSPVVLRSTAGRLDSPLGEVVAIASEHDDVAGTLRGPNTIFVLELDGVRIAHFGDFGQAQLREEQARAIGEVDLVFLPVGGGPTIDAEAAALIVERLDPSWVVPMHYRTHRVDFLEPLDAFLERMPRHEPIAESAFELPAGADGTTVLAPAAP